MQTMIDVAAPSPAAKKLAPPVKVQQVKKGGRTGVVYTRGDPDAFRAMSAEFDKRFPRRKRRAGELSAAQSVRALRDGRT